MKGNDMNRAYRYKFREGIDPRDVEDTLLLAFLAAEGIFGEARVRMDGSYSADHAKNLGTPSILFGTRFARNRLRHKRLFRQYL